MLDAPAFIEFSEFVRDKLRAIVSNQLLRYAVSGQIGFQLLNGS